jgi:hypothetical protein
VGCLPVRAPALVALLLFVTLEEVTRLVDDFGGDRPAHEADACRPDGHPVPRPGPEW